MIDRRRFLISTGSSLSALLAACNSDPRAAERILRYAERKNETLERGLFRHTSMDRVGRNVANTSGSAYPTYYVADTVPIWNASVAGQWSLEVSGMVGRPLRLSLADIQRLPRVTQRVNHYCVEGWTAVASWTGVRVSDLAALVGRSSDAQYVDFQSFDDGYHESWDIESALHPQTLIAYGMDGRLLGAAHGGPARVFSPIKLGYKNTKYLTRIVFQPERNGGYWSDQGYEWYGGT